MAVHLDKQFDHYSQRAQTIIRQLLTVLCVVLCLVIFLKSSLLFVFSLNFDCSRPAFVPFLGCMISFQHRLLTYLGVLSFFWCNHLITRADLCSRNVIC